MSEGNKHEPAAKPANDAGPAKDDPAEDAPIDLTADQGAVDVGPVEEARLDDDDGRTPAARRIAELEADLARMKDQTLRALAEAENTRKRAEKQAQDASRYGAAGLARDILSVADNLQRALAALPPERPDDSDLLKNLRSGVAMTAKELQDALARHHIRPVDPHGEKFDHNLHQAMFELESEEHPPGHVAQVMQIGYTLHDRLLRPAMVGVARKPANDAGK
jgi:molecular chaperone GrpE